MGNLYKFRVSILYDFHNQILLNSFSADLTAPVIYVYRNTIADRFSVYEGKKKSRILYPKQDGFFHETDFFIPKMNPLFPYDMTPCSFFYNMRSHIHG